MTKVRNDGKKLQDLVELVESKLNPEGYRVVTNWPEFDPDGNFLAEFDIQFIGTHEKSGLTWLIECRDRPSDGPAPGAWIEQLVGRRSRFNFTKVTAVSSTGFAVGARKYAVNADIELKETKAMERADFSRWLRFEAVEWNAYAHELRNVWLYLEITTDAALNEAMREKLDELRAPGGNEIPVVICPDGKVNSLMELFQWSTNEGKQLNDLVPNGPPKPLNFTLDLMNGGHVYEIENRLGRYRLSCVTLNGEVHWQQKMLPMVTTKEYRDAVTGELISQTVTFQPEEHNGMLLSSEFHRIPGTGFTHHDIRSVPVKGAAMTKSPRRKGKTLPTSDDVLPK